MFITAFRLFVLAISITFLFPIPVCRANDYYVSVFGRDSNDGSQAHPWLTLQHAATSLVLGPKGTTVHVAPGTYSAYQYCSIPAVAFNGYAMVCVQQSGTANQPIIFQSDQTWQAKLTCGYGHGGLMFALAASYVQIMGFDMTCPGDGTYPAFAADSFGNNGHNQFINNYVHDMDTSGCHSLGTFTSTPNNTQRATDTNFGHNVARGNIIHHIGSTTVSAPQCNQEHGIYFSMPYDAAVNNIVSGVIGWGIHFYGSGVCHQIIANNTVFDNSQGGVRVENIGSDGIHPDYCQNGGATDYETVVNNIVVNNGHGKGYNGFVHGGGIDGLTGYPIGPHNLYSNNLLYGNLAPDMALSPPDVSLNQLTGTNASVFQNYQDDPNWAPASGYSYLNYTLAPGSPAEQAGTANCAPGVASCAPTVDVTGVSRSDGIDIGAFQ
jgi:hypothetical protein